MNFSVLDGYFDHKSGKEPDTVDPGSYRPPPPSPPTHSYPTHHSKRLSILKSESEQYVQLKSLIITFTHFASQICSTPTYTELVSNCVIYSNYAPINMNHPLTPFPMRTNECTSKKHKSSVNMDKLNYPLLIGVSCSKSNIFLKSNASFTTLNTLTVQNGIRNKVWYTMRHRVLPQHLELILLLISKYRISLKKHHRIHHRENVIFPFFYRFTTRKQRKYSLQ